MQNKTHTTLKTKQQNQERKPLEPIRNARNNVKAKVTKTNQKDKKTSSPKTT